MVVVMALGIYLVSFTYKSSANSLNSSLLIDLHVLESTIQ